MLFLPNTTAEGKIRLLMSGHFGGEFQSSSIKTMTPDDSTSAVPAYCHHEVPEQNPGNSRAACRRKAKFGRMPAFSFGSRVRSPKIGRWLADSAGIHDPAVGPP